MAALLISSSVVPAGTRRSTYTSTWFEVSRSNRARRSLGASRRGAGEARGGGGGGRADGREDEQCGHGQGVAQCAVIVSAVGGGVPCWRHGAAARALPRPRQPAERHPAQRLDRRLERARPRAATAARGARGLGPLRTTRG